MMKLPQVSTEGVLPHLSSCCLEHIFSNKLLIWNKKRPNTCLKIHFIFWNLDYNILVVRTLTTSIQSHWCKRNQITYIRTWPIYSLSYCQLQTSTVSDWCSDLGILWHPGLLFTCSMCWRKPLTTSHNFFKDCVKWAVGLTTTTAAQYQACEKWTFPNGFSSVTGVFVSRAIF